VYLYCCFVGSLGFDCSINASLPPLIIGSRRSPVCDARGPNPCLFVSLFLANFAFLDTFSCRFVRMTLHLVDVQSYMNLLPFSWYLQRLNFINAVCISGNTVDFGDFLHRSSTGIGVWSSVWYAIFHSGPMDNVVKYHVDIDGVQWQCDIQ